MDAAESRRARATMTERERREEAAWTRDLLAATVGLPECCRAEVIRTGGVVGSCGEHP